MKSFETLRFDSSLILVYERSLKGLIVWLGEPVISQVSSFQSSLGAQGRAGATVAKPRTLRRVERDALLIPDSELVYIGTIYYIQSFNIWNVWKMRFTLDQSFWKDVGIILLHNFCCKSHEYKTSYMLVKFTIAGNFC